MDKAYREANAEKVKAKNQAWRLANRDRERERQRAYAAENRDRLRPLRAQIDAKRKAAKLGLVVTKADYRSILAAFGMVCHICGGEIRDGELHFDHVVPLAAGGAHTPGNIRPAHGRCNQRKGSRLMAELQPTEGE